MFDRHWWYGSGLDAGCGALLLAGDVWWLEAPVLRHLSLDDGLHQTAVIFSDWYEQIQASPLGVPVFSW